MLYEPGKIDGLTAGMLQRVTQRAYDDHNFQPRECDCIVLDSNDPSRPHDNYCSTNLFPVAPMLLPSQVAINEIAEPKEDQNFDRVSYGRWHEEHFWLGGERYKVITYHGPWTCVTDAGVVRRDIPERVIAHQLTWENGPHPDPYIAVVEVTYDTAGHRAGYGVRRSGSISIWYD